MLSVKKILIVAGILGASLVGMSASQAQAGGHHRHRHFHHKFHHIPVYKKVIIHQPIYTPVYNYCAPSYGFGY